MMRALPRIGVGPNAPAFDGAHTEPHQLTGWFLPRAGEDRLFDEGQDPHSELGAVPSSASPQIAWTFFFSTKSAAVSANAASLRRNSRSSS